MENLSGDRYCDFIIREELDQAGITILNLREPGASEVPYTLYGTLGGKELEDHEREYMARHGFTIKVAAEFHSFVFTRAWYYWVVRGFVPLETASEIYADEIGKRYVRAAGFGNGEDPKKHLRPSRVCGHQVVGHYHIDSQDGLNFFVHMLREHNLV